MVQRRAAVHVIMNFQVVLYKAGNLFTTERPSASQGGLCSMEYVVF
jgi:hypothetical protein